MSLIVAALDTSPRALGVLAAATKLARATGSKLLVLRAVGLPQDLPMELYGISPNALPTHLVEAARKAMEDLVVKVDAQDLDLELDAHIGTPWRTICQVAEDRKAELIIVGTHGHTVLDSLLGTTSARVVDHAKCSVLVVRQPAEA